MKTCERCFRESETKHCKVEVSLEDMEFDLCYECIEELSTEYVYDYNVEVIEK